MTLLEAKRLNVCIAKTQVCKDLDLRIEAGQRWAVLGRNGVGKTTLLHSLAGLHCIESGTLLLDDKALNSLERRLIAKRMGLLLQEHPDGFPQTVLDRVLMGRHPHIPPWAWESKIDYDIASAAIRRFSLQGLEQRLLSTLSGGERQRVALAALFTQDPALFLLDEPTNHLDLKYQVSLLDETKRHLEHANKAAIMVLHDINMAAAFCNRFLLLFGHGETLQGDAEEVLTRECLQRVYQYPIRIVDSDQGRTYLPEFPNT